MVLFIEPHYDDFLLSAGMFSFQRPVDKVITVFKSERNTGGTRELCRDLGKKYEELGFPNIDWKKPNILFEPEDLAASLNLQMSGVTLILTTLGVGNYAHQFLRQYILNRYFGQTPILFFRDFPHSYDMNKLGYIPFSDHVKDFEMVETVGSLDDFHKKLSMFKRYYPEQRGIMWFEREQFFKPVKEETYKFVKRNDTLW